MSVCVRTHVCVCVCMCVYVCVHVCVYVCMCVYVCVCVYSVTLTKCNPKSVCKQIFYSACGGLICSCSNMELAHNNAYSCGSDSCQLKINPDYLSSQVARH